MCNLYRLDAPANQIAAALGAEAGKDAWQGGYVAPARFGPVVTRGADGKTRIQRPMHWGYPPPGWHEGDPRPRFVTNVRNLESPFWIGNLRHSTLRCLVPVTSFQEWGAKPNPQTGRKDQHWFHLPAAPIFAFAGIWRDLTDMPVFAFLTTEPNKLVGSVHPKAMPVILHPEDYDTWLTADWKEAQKLVAPFPTQLMGVVGPDKPPEKPPEWGQPDLL